MKNLSVTIKIIILVMLIQTGCIGLHQRNSPVNRNNKCQVPLSHECSHATNLWQNTIDSVVQANYPSEIGYYQSIIWEDDFNNAWVIKGHEINITKQFVLKLAPPQRLCVAAHELAHLKLGHYYSKIGIVIDTNFLPKSGQTIRAEGRGLNEEEEANELALAFIKNLQLGNGMAQLCENAFIKLQT
ncbi:MAG: M48 family metalloprotease [Kordiimonadaceae bacterium]|nr:M48 family metalloprotease [Kordiimonadaceae bacterium]